jgi:hypothetical protein
VSPEFSSKFPDDEEEKKSEAAAANTTNEDAARCSTRQPTIGEAVHPVGADGSRLLTAAVTITSLHAKDGKRFVSFEDPESGATKYWPVDRLEPVQFHRGRQSPGPASPTWVPLELHAPLEAARRRWMNDAHGLCSGGVNLEALVRSIEQLAGSLLEQRYLDAHIRAAIREAISEMESRALDKAA